MCTRILCLAYQKLSNCYLLCAMRYRLVSVAHSQTPYPKLITMDGSVYFRHMLLSLLISRISYAGSNGRATSIVALVRAQRVRTRKRDREIFCCARCVLCNAFLFLSICNFLLSYTALPNASLLQPCQMKIGVFVIHSFFPFIFVQQYRSNGRITFIVVLKFA